MAGKKLCSKLCFFWSVLVCLDPWTVLRQADLQRYLFSGGKGMFLCFWVKKIVPVDTALCYEIQSSIICLPSSPSCRRNRHRRHYRHPQPWDVSPSLPFRAGRNPATSSPPSQWQVVSFGGIWWRHDIETPLSNGVRLLFVCRPSFSMKLQRPLQENYRIPTRTQGGGQHRDASPSRATASPTPAPAHAPTASAAAAAASSSSSSSSPPRSSCHAAPQRSAIRPDCTTWSADR